MFLRLPHHPPLDCSVPRIMGILNITPDSFAADPADPARHQDPGAATDAAAQMLGFGAALIDIGAESTRPGSQSVPPAEQLRRILPVLTRLRKSLPASAILSIDTTSAQVATATLDAGADIINDVSGATADPALLLAVARANAALILMHRLLPPASDHYSDRYPTPPAYTSLIADVTAFFTQSRIPAALEAGIHPEAILIDPGLGFGKSVQDNLLLLAAAQHFITAASRPLLSALSRKSFVGRVSLHTDSLPSERLAGTLALSVAHLYAGARIFRVHDVHPHAQALAAAWAAISASHPPP